MTETPGDNLVAARRFMNLCQSNMSEIFSGKNLPLSEVVMRLGDIQSQAKIMRAKSIFRSAQSVIEDLTKRNSVSECVNSVLALQNLIRQYNQGLTEIAPITMAPKPIRTSSSGVKTSHGPVIVSDLSRQTEAARILGPLIKFADKKDQKSLISLLSKAANDKPRRAKRSKRKFDVIMPNLTNQWLRLARAHQKSISVSVASDDVNVDSNTLRLIQSALLKLGNVLILECVATPEARAAQNLSQSAHLAVTTRINGNHLDILVSCEGRTRPGFRFEEVQAQIEFLGGRLNVNEDNNIIRSELFQIPLDQQLQKTAVHGAAS